MWGFLLEKNDGARFFFEDFGPPLSESTHKNEIKEEERQCKKNLSSMTCRFM
jgi:hypothetical protein